MELPKGIVKYPKVTRTQKTGSPKGRRKFHLCERCLKNNDRSRAVYERMKSDPVRYAKYLERVRANYLKNKLKDKT